MCNISSAASGFLSCKHGYHPQNHLVIYFIISSFNPFHDAIEISLNRLLLGVGSCARGGGD